MSLWELAFSYSVARKPNAFKLTLERTWDAKVTGVFGPSGSGKTTLLEILLGLRNSAHIIGRAAIDGRELFQTTTKHALSPRARGFGWVPQDSSLFPHMTVQQNLAFGARGTLSLDDEKRIITILELDQLLDRRPYQLSGGEKQRAALGRALFADPPVLLLDEPLAALDLVRRRRLLGYIRRVAETLPVSMLYISHDWDEIVELCDVALKLDAGCETEFGRPNALSAP